MPAHRLVGYCAAPMSWFPFLVGKSKISRRRGEDMIDLRRRIASRLATAAVLAGAVCANAGDFGQGPKLFGTGAAGGAQQGISVALSSDGSTAIVGGSADSSSAGAAWVFTRSGG